jgi:polar amino acid transport system substrate-binding protein
MIPFTHRNPAVVILSCAIAAQIACSNLPRDPKNTLAGVRQRPMRVGLVVHAPWVIRTNDEPGGAEVDLVRQFATSLGTTAEWQWGGEQELLEALGRYDLDLVIGGLTRNTPWKEYVGLTSPYFTENYQVGSRSQIEDIKGARIGVNRGDMIASFIGRKGAVAVPVDDLSKFEGPVAASDWQLEQMGLHNSGITLRSDEHVMATPPGENGFIKRLDEFLYQNRGQVKSLLALEMSQNEISR